MQPLRTPSAKRTFQLAHMEVLAGLVGFYWLLIVSFHSSLHFSCRFLSFFFFTRFKGKISRENELKISVTKVTLYICYLPAGRSVW